MEFDWDPAKDVTNFQKHEIEFLEAVKVFEDPFNVIEDSSRPEHAENRWKAIGQIDGLIFAVIYTLRGSQFRIISARRAKVYERRIYSQGQATN